MRRKPSSFPAPARPARSGDGARRGDVSEPRAVRRERTSAPASRAGDARARSGRPADPWCPSVAWGAAQPSFLPMSREEMDALGWDALDVLLINGDAYVDHPSFGAVLLGRWLTAHGFRVGLVAQPRWDTPDDIARMGRPRLFAGVSAGAVDSLLAHYTAFRKKRHDDAYTPGGRAGARPNRACIVYTNLVRRAFPGLPVALGGIEASTRRVSHYDFWTDSLRRPLLLDAKADILIYGMGERAILELARRLDRGEDWRGIPGTAWLDKSDAAEASPRPRFVPCGWDKRPCMTLPSHAEILAEPKKLLTLTRDVERHVHRRDAWAVQPVEDRLLVMAPPAAILTTEEMDALYALPFRRTAHPLLPGQHARLHARCREDARLDAVGRIRVVRLFLRIPADRQLRRRRTRSDLCPRIQPPRAGCTPFVRTRPGAEQHPLYRGRERRVRHGRRYRPHSAAPCPPQTARRQAAGRRNDEADEEMKKIPAAARLRGRMFKQDCS